MLVLFECPSEDGRIFPGFGDVWAQCTGGWVLIDDNYVEPVGGNVEGTVTFESGLDTATFELAVESIILSMAIAGAFFMIKRALR